MVGEGGYKEEFKRLAGEKEVGDYIIFTGGIPQERMIDFYDLCDIFVMPNRPRNNSSNQSFLRRETIA